MSFREKDEKFQQQILGALIQRQTINMNKEVGVMYMQAEWEDKINPSVTITRDEIKKETGRDKCRDVVLDEYSAALQKPGVVIERPNNDSLRVSLAPVRIAKNEFSSVSALKNKNETELEGDPELADPPY